MLHYLLLFVFALSLLACPSKPQRRAPVIPGKHSDDVKKNSTVIPGAVFKGAGIYLVLQQHNDSYEPTVLRISERGVTIEVEAKKAYSSAAVFSPEQKLGTNNFNLSKVKNDQDVNLLLEFNEGVDTYCVASPLKEVLTGPTSWVRGKNATEIKHKLQQASNAQPTDISNSKGELKQEDGGWKCEG